MGRPSDILLVPEWGGGDAAAREEREIIGNNYYCNWSVQSSRTYLAAPIHYC